MSINHKFQLALHLKSLRNIGIRQTCFLQLRTVVYQKIDKKQNLTAKPYEIINLQNVQNKDQSSWALIEDQTFLSPKIMVKNTDKNINIDCMCLFKGQIITPNAAKYNNQLFIYSQLIWYQGKQVQVLGQWKGFSKLTTFQSYLDIYFSTHMLTCSITASAHCILSQVIFSNQQRLLPLSKQKIFFNHIAKKQTQLYDACIDPLIDSFKSLKIWLESFRDNHVEQLQEKYKNKNNSSILQQKNLQLKYSNLSKKMDKKSIQELQIILNKLNPQQYMQNLKIDSFNISTILYPIWKELLFLFKKYPQSYFIQILKQQYHKNLQKDHWQNRIILTDPNSKTIKHIFLPQTDEQLQFCSVEQNTSQIKLSCKDMEALNKNINKKKNKLIVLVHGFQASSFDMQSIAMYFKFRNPDCHLLISESNQGMTEGIIEECGHRLAIEVKNYINARQLKDFSISFIGHSLGGIIIRASLRYLQLYKNNFQCYISICSPHMGYLYHTSTIVTTSLWVLNQVKKDQSMIELAMSDNKDLNKCYMYELSQRKQLAWFNTVVFLGSKQDEYVPYSSAIMENMEFFYKSQSAKVYQSMYNNVIKPIQQKVIRLQIIFNDKVKDLSGFIGRTAHIKVLSFLPIIQLYCHLLSKRI